MRAPALLRIGGIGILPFLAACGGDARAAGPMVRDSAGVRIVENTSPAWKEGEGWRLSEEPGLDIGMLDGPPEYQFGQVMGAVRQSDGTVVVGDDQSKNLRFFDRSGRHVRTVGREGGGPGEFKSLLTLSAAGDSLVVGDWSNRRISVFAPDGSLVRSISLSTDVMQGFVIPLGRLSDGRLLLRTGSSFDMSSRAGLFRDSVRLVRLEPDGKGIRDLGRFAGGEMYVVKEERSISVSPRAFGRGEEFAVLPDGFAYGTSDGYELGSYDAEGKLRRLVRREQAVRRVAPEDVDRYRAAQMRNVDARVRPMFERGLAEMPFPETFPAYDEIVADRSGNLWVRDFRVVEEDPSRWTVFDPEGRMLGTVTMPPRFRVFEIGGDYVLGAWKDDLDVDHIRMFSLEKAGAGR